MVTKKGKFPVSLKTKPKWVFIGFLFSPTYSYEWYQWILYISKWEDSKPTITRFINIFGLHFTYNYIALDCEYSELTKRRFNKRRTQ